LAGATGADEVMIIGGAQLYRTLMPLVDRQYITQIFDAVEGDATFDAPDETLWRLSEEKTGLKTEKDNHDFVVQVWDRV